MLRIALVGDRQPLHPSHRELEAARGMLGADVRADWVATDSSQMADLSSFDGIWLIPGSPYADDAAALDAVRWARTTDVPFLGTCGGLQYSVLEYVRNVLGRPEATHAESDGPRSSNVVTPLACRLDGEQRLVRPIPGTRFAALVGTAPFLGMHYCSYAPSAQAIADVTAAGMQVQAEAEDAGAEVLALPDQRFYMLSLFQPHVGSLAGRPLHPLIGEFVRCARAHAAAAAG